MLFIFVKQGLKQSVYVEDKSTLVNIMTIIASSVFFCSSVLQYASQKIFLLATCNDLYCYPLSV